MDEPAADRASPNQHFQPLPSGLRNGELDPPTDRTSNTGGPYRSRLEDVDALRVHSRWRWVVWLCGVILPLGVLCFELVMGWCHNGLFDPLPSLAHVVLVALVPVANLLALSWRATRFAWLQRFFNGAALVVTGIYSLIFVPLVPLSLIALLYFGLGLLSLSPFFALGATLAARRLIAARTWLEPAPRFKPGLIGALVAFLTFGGAALPEPSRSTVFAWRHWPTRSMRAKGESSCVATLPTTNY